MDAGRCATRKFQRQASLRSGDVVVHIDDEGPPRRPFYQNFVTVWFCWLAFGACCTMFIVEMGENEWEFQPMTCGADAVGCQPNIMLGPSVDVLYDLGAKNDEAIFAGEWWRVIACNWLHGGLIHLVLNMHALYALGAPLERRFGTVRVGALYIGSGLFGTTVSVIFLQDVISVGASASIFGLLGAYWGNIVTNYCARRARPPQLVMLTAITLVNLGIGLTPSVDNFMHLGGLVAGFLAGTVLFAHRGNPPNSSYTRRQRIVATCATVLTAILAALAIAASASPAFREALRACESCHHINCFDTPWWSCCVLETAGSCRLEVEGARTTAFCERRDVAFEVVCDALVDATCVFNHADSNRATHRMCHRLCSSC